jgi:glycine receptor alpha-3
MKGETIFMVFFSLVLGIQALESQVMGKDASRIAEKMLGPSYDGKVRPNYGGEHIDVNVTLYILNVPQFSPEKRMLTVSMYFRQMWRDPRLVYSSQAGNEYIILDAEQLQKLWVPDTFFANLIKGSWHQILTPNVFTRIYSNGTVFMSKRLELDLVCPMDVHKFPFDTQVCSLEVESYGYSNKDIRYKWGKGQKSMGFDSNIESDGFQMTGIEHKSAAVTLSSGTYSRIIGNMEFTRISGYFMGKIYYPSGVLVVLSWIAFFVNRRHALFRVGFGVVLVLASTLQLMYSLSNRPQVGYFTNAECFISMSSVLIMGSLIESLIILWYNSKERTPNQPSDSEACGKLLGEPQFVDNSGYQQMLNKVVESGKLDIVSRITFPLIFVVYNLFYWTVKV